MPVDCQRSTSGGKGNRGMFIERDRSVCAAGLPTAQPDYNMKDSLQHYCLNDEADALIHDAILPPKPPKKLPPLRHPIPRDMRNAEYYTHIREDIFPGVPTKFQTLAEDCKNTAYASFWKKPLGQSRDPIPMLPAGFPIKTTTFGKTSDYVSLYDVIMPKTPLPDKTPPYKQAGAQKTRKYCESFNPDAFFGHKTGANKSGGYVKKCLTYENLENGIVADVITSRQAEYLSTTHPLVGQALTPNDNIKEVPKGSSFGSPSKPPLPIAASLTSCPLLPEKEFVKNCFAHLNSVRKCLKSKYLPDFFLKFYLLLKSFDKERSGWLIKDIVYEQCVIKMIRFDTFLIESLLALYRAYDGSRIKYKTFIHMLNYTEPPSEIPKIPDTPGSCLEYQTTYMDMNEPACPDVRPMAAVPSGRYIDLDYPITPEGYCKATRSLLPQESDIRSCLNPNVFTLYHVSHRDMYAKRDSQVVRKVFENIGERFTDETFKEIWEEAEKYHSQGWVCFETFRRALNKQAKE